MERLLNEALVEVGQTALLQQVLVPLIEAIGRLWHEGELRVAHEHVATAVIRTFLGNCTRPHSVAENSPTLVVTTPAGQMHELGAILAAAAAASHGWRVTYLGPCLPAEEIAGAAIQDKARAVAISLVYPEDDPRLEPELRRLRRLLPPEVALLIGGRAARSFAHVIRDLDATLLEDLPGLGLALERLRRPRRAKEPPKP